MPVSVTQDGIQYHQLLCTRIQAQSIYSQTVYMELSEMLYPFPVLWKWRSVQNTGTWYLRPRSVCQKPGVICFVAYIFIFQLLWVGWGTCIWGLPQYFPNTAQCNQNEVVTNDNHISQRSFHELKCCRMKDPIAFFGTEMMKSQTKYIKNRTVGSFSIQEPSEWKYVSWGVLKIG